MTSINVPLKVVGDNFLIKITSKGTYDVQDNHLTISFIEGKFYRQNLKDCFTVSTKVQTCETDLAPLSLSGVLYLPLDLGAKPAFI